MLTGAEQRRVAEVFIGGFLEATLNGRREYLPMFRDVRTAAAWLPRTIYFSQFEDSTYRTVSDFDAGIDLTRVQIEHDGLTTAVGEPGGEPSGPQGQRAEVEAAPERDADRTQLQDQLSETSQAIGQTVKLAEWISPDPNRPGRSLRCDSILERLVLLLARDSLLLKDPQHIDEVVIMSLRQ